MNQYLDVNPEVSAAIAAGKPVVALESTIISHGMPYPQNVETALSVEKIIRENGATRSTTSAKAERQLPRPAAGILRFWCRRAWTARRRLPRR